MTMGVPATGIGIYQGESINSALARGATSYSSLTAAQAAGQSTIQGMQRAVTPTADDATGQLAPPIPGGLQMTGSFVLVQALPVPVQKKDLIDPPLPGNR